MEETITEKLADFVERSSYSNIPEEVAFRAKGYILDYLGVALAGSRAESSQIMAILSLQRVNLSGPIELVGSPCDRHWQRWKKTV